MTAAAALQPAQAKAPAAAAAPPVFAPAIDSGAFDTGPIGSLSQVPLSAPAANAPIDVSAAPTSSVQRKCETCGGDEAQSEGDHEEVTTNVRPRLEVGAADDPFEREADAIAGQVMALRDSDVARSYAEPSAAPSGVQRACSACSQASRDDEVRARHASAEVSMDEEEAPRMQGREAGAGPRGGESIAAAHSDLTSGGSALPEATRTFFEDRMGRDLSDVRLHTGHAAHDYSTSISAKAFTYENHIWLGKGETTGPSFTMAHELAHVLQQTSPGPVGPGQNVYAMRDRGAVRRSVDCHAGEQFFFPAGESHTTEGHDEALRHASADHSLLGEIRVPNANADGITHTARSFGFADLVRANGPVGIGFVGPMTLPSQGERFPWNSARIERSSDYVTPINLSNWHNRPPMRNGQVDRNLYAQSASPFLAGNALGGYQRDASSAPASLEIGDMKFAGESFDRTYVERQVDRYISGFRLAYGYYNQTVANYSFTQAGPLGGSQLTQPNGIEPSRWGAFSASRMSTGGMSTRWRRIGSRENLEVGKWVPNPLRAVDRRAPRKKISPCNRTRRYHGHLYYRKNPSIGVRWDYIWWPDATSGEYGPTRSAMFRAYLRRSRELHRSASQAPTSAQRRVVKANPALHATHSLGRDKLRKVRPQRRRGGNIPRRDPFVENYSQWRTEQRALTREWGSFGADRQSDGDIGNLLFHNAIRSTSEAVGTTPGTRINHAPERRIREGVSDLARIDRMSGASGRYIGILRKTFGGAYVKVANIYRRLRTRFDAFMADRRRGGRSRGSGLGKAAMKVGAMIFAAITRELLPRVGELLLDCLQTGFRSKMDEMFSADLDALVGNRIEEIQTRYQEIESQIETEIHSITDRIFGDVSGRFQSILDTWHIVGQLVSIARTAFNAARIAVCAAGGLETLGAACVIAGIDFLLSLIGLSPLELLAASLLGTCLAQQMIAEHILTIQAVRDTPRYIATTLLDVLREHLPDEVSGLLCEEISGEAELPSVDEITCGEGGTSGGGSTSSWSPPAGVPLSTLNRPATLSEIEEHGRLRAAQTQADTGSPAAGDADDPPEAQSQAETGAQDADAPSASAGEDEESAEGGVSPPAPTTTTNTLSGTLDGEVMAGTGVVESGVSATRTYNNDRRQIVITMSDGSTTYSNQAVTVIVVRTEREANGTVKVHLYFPSNAAVTFCQMEGDEPCPQDLSQAPRAYRTWSPTPGSDNVFISSLRGTGP